MGQREPRQATAPSNRGNLFQQLLPLPAGLVLGRHRLEESGRACGQEGRGWCRPQSLLAAAGLPASNNELPVPLQWARPPTPTEAHTTQLIQTWVVTGQQEPGENSHEVSLDRRSFVTARQNVMAVRVEDERGGQNRHNLAEF